MSVQARLFRLHQISLVTEFPLSHHLSAGLAPVQLELTVLSRPPQPDRWKEHTPVYRSPRLGPDGNSLAHLYRLPTGEVLHFPESLDFHLADDQILCAVFDPAALSLVELRLLGPVLSYWLERQGIPTLHASAVRIGCGAVGFLAAPGEGKSGLASALVATGSALLTDDILAIEEQDGTFRGRPAYPQMRMWPDEALHFFGRFEDLPRVHPELEKRRVKVGPGGFGLFQDLPLPLSLLYVTERIRGGGSLEIRELSRQEALIELIRHSFSPTLVEAAGLQPARFDRLARLVQQVPVKRLRYPSGFDLLPRVAEAVRLDLERC